MQSLYQTCLGPGGRHPSLRHSSGHCPCTRRTGGGGRKAARGLAASASAWLPEHSYTKVSTLHASSSSNCTHL